jgi:hypothetical protein
MDPEDLIGLGVLLVLVLVGLLVVVVLLKYFVF